MADRGRDFKVRILSDVDKFDLDKPAGELESLGTEADSTATKVDSAFEKIARSSRSNLRKVDDDVDKAKKGLDEFKGEANSSGREAAASFSGGFDDITDTVQEIAANAFAGFGALGAAAGLAAAVGVALITKSLTESKDRVADLTESFRNMRRDGIDPAREGLKDFVQDIPTEELLKFKDATDKTGVSLEDFMRARAGDPDAMARVRAGIDKNTDSLGVWERALGIGDQATEDLTGALDEAEQAHRDNAEASLVEAEATRNSAAASEAATKAAEDHKDSVDALAGVLGDVATDSDSMASAIELAATRQANATKDAEDSWEDYRDTAVASVDDVIAKQLEQLTAAADFEKNTKVVFDRLGQDAVDWATSQGENADKAMQLLANAPVEKGQQVVDNYRRLGQKSTEANAEGVLAGKPATASAADEIRADMKGRLGKPINVPVGVTGPTSADLAATRAGIQRGLSGITVSVNAVAQSIIGSATRSRP